MDLFAEYFSFCAACLTLTVVLVCHHSFCLFHPSPSASVLSPPTCFTLFTNSPSCIALSVSVQLCYPTQTVLSPPVFLPPNLLFVLRRLQHSLVMFFFLRSHFRTSEGDQEKIGLRKPAVKGSSTPFALQISAQHSDTFRPSSSLSEKQVVSGSTCLVSFFDASTSSELPQPPASDLRYQGLVSSDVISCSLLLFLIFFNMSLQYSLTNNRSAFKPLIPHPHPALTHTHPHTLVDTLQLHYAE